MNTNKQRRRLIQAYYNEFATEHNNKIYASSEWKDFKGVNFDAIQEKISMRKELLKEIEALQAQAAIFHEQALELAGQKSSYWFNTEDLAETHNMNERSKAFEGKLKPHYLSEDNLLVGSDRYKNSTEETVAKKLLDIAN